MDPELHVRKRRTHSVEVRHALRELLVELQPYQFTCTTLSLSRLSLERGRPPPKPPRFPGIESEAVLAPSRQVVRRVV